MQEPSEAIGGGLLKALVRGAELPAPHELMIAQLPSNYSLYSDERGNEVTDPYHYSLENAQAIDQILKVVFIHAPEGVPSNIRDPLIRNYK
jgi:hypothetical protein